MIDLGGRVPSFRMSPSFINSSPARREQWYLAPFLVGNVGSTSDAGNLQVVYGAKDWISGPSDDVGMAKSTVQPNGNGPEFLGGGVLDSV